VSGLLLQTLFRNPLAGPSILGISEGANLGVGVVVLLLGGTLGYAGVLVGAMVGSAGVLLVLVYYSERVRNYMTLLIVGLMVGYLSGSVLAVLTYRASPEAVRGMLLWGLGHFGGVSRSEVWLLGLLVGVGLLGSLGLMKPLNAVVLGESYASNLGIQMRYVRRSILLITGLLTGSVTAFCGPVSFIGLAVPHMTRMVFRTSNQQVLVPGVMLVGSGVGLLCNLLTEVLGGKGGVLPLNAVTPMVGVPVVIYITMRTFGGSKKD
jgi:iron complex transport system permease protein